MARLNNKGSVTARCPGCDGALSTFEWSFKTPDDASGSWGERRGPIPAFGRIVQQYVYSGQGWVEVVHLLMRCAGCGCGGIAVIEMEPLNDSKRFPLGVKKLLSFHPEAGERLKLPEAVPQGIQNEFREAERCLEAECFRAAAGMFRSVLDKTMGANGYQTKGVNLFNQIEVAAKDGVITESRKKRAHEDIRVLGNDVLHDEWEEIRPEAVELAHHYAQRILEDFYDDRPTMLALLRAKSRVPDEDKKST